MKSIFVFLLERTLLFLIMFCSLKIVYGLCLNMGYMETWLNEYMDIHGETYVDTLDKHGEIS